MVKNSIEAHSYSWCRHRSKRYANATTDTVQQVPMVRNMHLGNLFLIDDTQDSDATNTHGKNGKTTQKAMINMRSLAKAKEYVAKVRR